MGCVEGDLAADGRHSNPVEATILHTPSIDRYMVMNIRTLAVLIWRVAKAAMMVR